MPVCGASLNVLSDYKLAVNEYKALSCLKGDEDTFANLMKNFRGSGIYQPMSRGVLVKGALKNFLSKSDFRLKWLQTTLNDLEKNSISSDRHFSVQLATLTTILIENMKLQTSLEKNLSLATSNSNLFKTSFLEFIKGLYFLRSFSAPVDHFANRRDYELLAEKLSLLPQSDPGYDALAEEKLTLYLNRKLYEDGAMSAAKTENDLPIRAVLDTLEVKLKNQGPYFSVDFIKDFFWWKANFLAYLNKYNADDIVKRHKEWIARSQELYNAYLALLKKKELVSFNSGESATEELKKFVYKKFQILYKYWAAKPEDMRKLFVLQNILLHEVGRTDPTGVQRKRVMEVVYNRLQYPDYQSFYADEQWVKELENLEPKGQQWLTVMMRRGEFSFALYFMNSVQKLFCLEKDFLTSSLNEENMSLIVSSIDNQNVSEEKILRYFSRVSMLGRINMSTIWSPPYMPAHEVLGPELPKELKAKIVPSQYQLLYEFGTGNRVFMNVEGGDPSYYVEQNGTYFSYLDPDYFQFFYLP
jgi:hypothetical protein